MAEIKGKGLPTRNTKGALGDIYIDTTTGIKYKCTGSFTINTHSNAKAEYDWKPVRNIGKNGVQPVKEEKPHETPKKQSKAKAVEKVEKEVVEEKKEEAAPAKENAKSQKNNGPHSYTKYFEETKSAE